MRIHVQSFSLMIFVFLLACDQQGRQEEKSLNLFEKAIAAHGGIEKWKNQKQFSFTVTSHRGDQSSQEEITTDLNKRYERIRGDGYELGYDGENYWQTREDTSMQKKNTRFIINLQFYFLAMPFVLTDPGVNIEEMGTGSMAGKEYDVLKATFDAGTGVAPEDQYILYLDPKTHKLAYMLYSVTYFNKENAEKYNANHYASWQEVDGLLLPEKIVSYVWDAEKQALGDMRIEKVFSALKFSESLPEKELFAMPEGAMVE